MDRNSQTTDDHVENESEFVHPHQIITRYLLSKVPSARMAIVGPNDWNLLMNENDVGLPSTSEIIRRLDLFYRIAYDEDTQVVSLEPKDDPPAGSVNDTVETTEQSSASPTE
ncbi:hypothetical protein BDQ17DRAFT_1434697 [Cyathus striatus]|nr:hypothetical protein BDQ17DRAFT_1434697 [Cyathus striatus]